MNRKYKIGDVLVPKTDYNGFESLTVYKIDDKFYYSKIHCGTVSIVHHVVEECYQLKED